MAWPDPRHRSPGTGFTLHYGFYHEELDFIINYDSKYRMGKELDGGENNDD